MTCLVLLGTYNGEKYLREQLDSILAQEDVEVSLLASDDRSSDGTVSILAEYAARFSNVRYTVNAANKNFTYNFLDLLFSVKESKYDFYAFSDQDDVWLPGKLKRAIGMLEKTERTHNNGALYCSNLIVADESLHPVGMQEGKSIRKANKRTFPFENIATGCTVVFDRDFLRHATEYYPKDIRLHDYWLFLIAAYTADYVYDEEGFILYRQHGGNQIGTNKHKWTIANFRRFLHYHGAQSRLTEEFLSGYGHCVAPEDLRRLETMRDYRKRFSERMKIVFCWRGRTAQKTFLLKLKALCGKL